MKNRTMKCVKSITREKLRWAERARLRQLGKENLQRVFLSQKKR